MLEVGEEVAVVDRVHGDLEVVVDPYAEALLRGRVKSPSSGSREVEWPEGGSRRASAGRSTRGSHHGGG